MSDVGPRFEHHRDTGKHVNGAILLHIAAVFYYDRAKVTTNRSAWADIDVFSDDHVASHSRVRMHKRRLVHHWNDSFERENIRHLCPLQYRGHTLTHTDAHRRQRVTLGCALQLV